MPRLTTLLIAAAALLLPITCCLGDDQVRLQVTVNKRTIVRPASTTIVGEERGRIQTLVLSAQNRSIRSLPEGSVAWTAVVRKQGSGANKYSGTGNLPPMLSFQSVEFQFGVFEVDARQTGNAISRDRIDYEVVISHGGKETYRMASVSNFAALAAAAQSFGKQDDGLADVHKNDNGSPARPVGPLPAEGGKMEPAKPGLPVAEVSKSPGEPPPVAPPVPQQPFDFFNLGGKKPPEAK